MRCLRASVLAVESVAKEIRAAKCVCVLHAPGCMSGAAVGARVRFSVVVPPA